MIGYISEIQRQFISKYGFEKGENGCPQNVPDGAYPMFIDDKLDLVIIKDGTIRCCNFIGKKDGLEEFQLEFRKKN